MDFTFKVSFSFKMSRPRHGKTDESWWDFLAMMSPTVQSRRRLQGFAFSLWPESFLGALGRNFLACREDHAAVLVTFSALLSLWMLPCAVCLILSFPSLLFKFVGWVISISIAVLRNMLCFHGPCSGAAIAGIFLSMLEYPELMIYLSISPFTTHYSQ